MNSFNFIGSYLKNVGFSIITYIYNYPLIDASLVLYYPLDSSNGNARTANYASGLPVYDASMMGLAMNTYDQNSFVTGLGDLSLNNTMGSVATSYVQTNTSFNLVPSNELSISLWFSCSGQLDTSGTLISLYQQSILSSIDIGLYGSTLFSRYDFPPPPFLVTGGGVKSASNSPNNNVNYVFTTDGMLTINVSCTIKVLLVGAGGSGGDGYGGGKQNGGQNGVSGGGGGGGDVFISQTINVNTPTTFNIQIGNSVIGQDGSATYFYSTDNIISYKANGGGRGATTTYNANYGGGGSGINGRGSGLTTYPYYNTGATNSTTTYKGSNAVNSYNCGGGGAGAGGNGVIVSSLQSVTVPTIKLNGGIGLTIGQNFINNYYSEGGHTYISPTTTLTNPYNIDSATLWNSSNYTNVLISNQLLSAPNNTGYGGIGGGFNMLATNPYSYAINGGAGGSGICIVSIIST